MDLPVAQKARVLQPRESGAARAPARRISGDSGSRPDCRNRPADFPAATAPPHTACDPCADLSARPASWGQSAACRGRGARSLRSAGSLRSNSASPSLSPRPTAAEQRIVETVVVFLRHRAVDVVGRAFVVARRQVHPRHINGIGFDDRADGIVEIQDDATAQPGDLPATERRTSAGQWR